MGKTVYIDMIGHRFGELTVLSKVKGRGYLCKCSCGKERIIDGFYLRAGRCVSCGDKIHKTGRGANDCIGKKFNHLTVKRFAFTKNRRRYYVCECDCGNETLVSSGKLGLTKSCGCIKGKEQRQDWVGRRFGNLTVVKLSERKDGKAFWLCRCDCGNERIVQGNVLQRGAVVSCKECKNKKIRAKSIETARSHIGEKHGLLTIEDIKFANGRSNAICECDCGNRKTILLTNVLNGNNKSCGCVLENFKHRRQFVDITGKRFRMLTALGYSHTEGKNAIFDFKCDCGNIVKLPSRPVRHGDITNCGCIDSHSSTTEKEIFEFVKSICDCDVFHRNKKNMGFELDVFIPEKKLAIECDGLIRFHEGNRNSHLEKTKACEEQGIRLIHFWDCEWNEKQDICKSMIASGLGVFHERLMARKCDVVEIQDKKFVRDFFDANHLQGSISRFDKAIGLRHQDRIVQIALFGRSPFSSSSETELLRMASVLNTQVQGGFSKILEHSGFERMISYVSRRCFNAAGYLKSGWRIESVSKPCLSYTEGHKLFSRHLFKKRKCLRMWSDVSEEMTEKEMCAKHNLFQVWDCGKLKMEWEKHKITIREDKENGSLHQEQYGQFRGSDSLHLRQQDAFFPQRGDGGGL